MADTIVTIGKALEDADLTVRGSRGQDIANPLLQERRMTQTAQAQLLARLKLPDLEPAQRKATPSENGIKAANARWHPQSQSV